jgi:hypothetical protein
VVVAGSWPSRSLHGLARYRAGLRGVPTAPRRDRSSLAEEPEPCGPRAFAPLQSSRCCPWSNLDLLSWDSSGGAERVATACAATRVHRAPYPPPPTPRARARVGDCRRASTPARIAARIGPEEPSSESRSVRVVSHHLDGFLRSEVAGLLHPAAGHGVRCVSGSRTPRPRRLRRPKPTRTPGGRTDIVPAARFTPPEGILASSRATSPWPLPPCRWRCPRSTRRSAPLPAHPRELRETTTSTSRRCSAVEFGRPATVAGRGSPCPSMGFVPLRGPSHRSGAPERAATWRGRQRIRRNAASSSPGSVPHRRSDRALPARLRPPLRATKRGGGPIRRSEDRAVAAWTRHDAVPKNDTAPGDVAPPLPVANASPRAPVSRTRRARADPRGGRNPFCGSPGSGRKPILPSLTEARIRGAAPRPTRACAQTDRRHEPVPKKSVQS